MTRLHTLLAACIPLMSFLPAMKAAQPLYTLSQDALMTLDTVVLSTPRQIVLNRTKSGTGVIYSIPFDTNTGYVGLESSLNAGDHLLTGRTVPAGSFFALKFTLLSVNGQPSGGGQLGVQAFFADTAPPDAPDFLSFGGTTSITSGTLTGTTDSVIGFKLSLSGSGWSPSGSVVNVLIEPAANASMIYNWNPNRADVNKDGKLDLIWQNDNTGDVVVWYMGGASGNQRQSSVAIPATGTTGWRIVGSGDFNADGTPDIVWQNNSTGQAVVWYMGEANGSQSQPSAWLNSAVLAGWNIVGIADFDSDGYPDIVWQNSTTRQVVAWYMGGANGTQHLSSSWLEQTGISGWTVVGVADLDGNGRPDLIWQNDSTRQVVVWYMTGANGTQHPASAWLQQSASATLGWTVIGIGDVNGDGKQDLIWQNDTDRTVVVWYMTGSNGNQSYASAWMNSMQLPGWRAIGPR